MINSKYKPSSPNSQLCTDVHSSFPPVTTTPNASDHDGDQSALGIDTKFPSTVCHSAQTTVNPMQTMRAGQWVRKAIRYPRKRFSEWSLMGKKNRKGHTYRVINCMRQIAPKWCKDDVTGERYAVPRDKVEIHRSDVRADATYRNLVVCGSVWICPICAARISECRAQELAKITRHPDYFTMLVTFTLRHTSRDALRNLIAGLLKAFDALKAGRPWQDIKTELGIVGTIRSLEVTFGKHGWHPHIHALIVLARNGWQDGDVTSEATVFEQWAKARWTHVLERAGYDASWEHGVTVKTTDGQVQDYIAKYGHQPDMTWPVERELAKAVTKQASQDGLTPWEILDKAFLSPTEGSRAHYMRLWLEYVQAMEGRHQLEMSENLRDLFGIGVQTDDELAASIDDDYKLFAELTWQEWAVILRHELRGELLDAAARMTFDQFKTWLASVPDMPNARMSLAELMDNPPPRTAMTPQLKAMLEGW